MDGDLDIHHDEDDNEQDLGNQEEYDFEEEQAELDPQAEIEADGYDPEADGDTDAFGGGEPEEEHIQFEEDHKDEAAEDAGVAVEDAAATFEEEAKAEPSTQQAVVQAQNGTKDAGNTAETAVNNSTQGQQEWLIADVPASHRPLPLIRVRNIPADTSLTAVKQLLSSHGVSVHDVAYDDQMLAGKRIALVRLPPAPLPQAQQHSAAEKNMLEAAPDGDVSKIAAKVVTELTGKDLQINGQKLAVDSSQQDVTLFIANLTPNFDNDAALRTKMQSFGNVVRCFVACNLEGKSKNYGIVEFQSPAAARKAKEWADKMEQTMRSAATSRTPEGRFQQIKLMKAEWTFTKTIPNLYGRVLYVANLQLFTADSALRSVFEKHGKLKDCYIPRQKGTGQGKGFAFVEYESSVDADRAYRTLDGQHQAALSTKVLVSFANPAKQQSTSTTPQGTQATTAKPAATSNTRNQTQQSGARSNTGNTGNRAVGRPAAPAGARPPAGPPPGSIVPAVAVSMMGPAMAPGMMPGGIVAPVPNPLMTANPMMSNPMAAMMMQQAAMQQQVQMQMRAQQLAMQQQMQQQVQQAQLAMQSQLQQTQAQLQAAQRTAQQYQQQATAAQLKAKQEAEARKRAEEAAQRQKAAFTAFPGYGVGAAGTMAFSSGATAADMATMNASAMNASMNAAAFGMAGYGLGAFGSQGMSAAGMTGLGANMAGQKRSAEQQAAAAFTAQGGYGFGMQGYGNGIQDVNKRMRF